MLIEGAAMAWPMPPSCGSGGNSSPPWGKPMVGWAGYPVFRSIPGLGWFMSGIG